MIFDPRIFTQQNRIVVGTIVAVLGPIDPETNALVTHAPADQFQYGVEVRFDSGSVTFNPAVPFNPRPSVEVEPYTIGQIVLGVMVGDMPGGVGVAFLFWERTWYDDCAENA